MPTTGVHRHPPRQRHLRRQPPQASLHRDPALGLGGRPQFLQPQGVSSLSRGARGFDRLQQEDAIDCLPFLDGGGKLTERSHDAAQRFSRVDVLVALHTYMCTRAV